MRYDRTVIGYHGCDESIAERLLRGEAFVPSRNDYDWLGPGVYFWEYGAARAMRFAVEQQKHGKVSVPAVVGAVLQLGLCFDLMDVRYTEDLATAYERWAKSLVARGTAPPVNAGSAPDHKLRRLDCAVLSWYLDQTVAAGIPFDSVRAGFVEGGAVYPGAGFHRETHIQLAVRNPACILGVFRPTSAWRSP